MSVPNLDRDAALRIALAAKAMPDVGIGKLLEILDERIDGEISIKTLKSITVSDINAGIRGVNEEEDGEDMAHDMSELKEAVRILWGEADTDSLPKPTPLLHMPERSIRVAVASNTAEKLDGHFGSCIRFLIYQVTETDAQLIDLRSAIDADLAEDKNGYRANLIKDCQVVYMVSVGGPAAAKIVRAGVYPMKRVKGGLASDAIAEMQKVMADAPPPWMAKHLGDAPEERIRYDQQQAIAQ